MEGFALFLSVAKKVISTATGRFQCTASSGNCNMGVTGLPAMQSWT